MIKKLSLKKCLVSIILLNSDNKVNIISCGYIKKLDFKIRKTNVKY